MENKWNKEKVIAALDAFVEENGRLPVAREMNSRHGLPSRRCFEYTVGMTHYEYSLQFYPELVEKGERLQREHILQSALEKKRWTASLLAEAVEGFVKVHGRMPNPHDYKTENGLPLYSTFTKIAVDSFTRQLEHDLKVHIGEQAPGASSQKERRKTMSQFKENQMFQFPTFRGHTSTVTVRVNSYLHNKNLYVGLTLHEDGYPEPFGDMSVNIDDLPPFSAALDTNNLPHVAEFVEREGLAKPTGINLSSGYCQYPVYQFDPEALRALDPGGCAQYEREVVSTQKHESADLAKEIEEMTGSEVTVIDLNMGM